MNAKNVVGEGGLKPPLAPPLDPPLVSPLFSPIGGGRGNTLTGALHMARSAREKKFNLKASLKLTTCRKGKEKRGGKGEGKGKEKCS